MDIDTRIIPNFLTDEDIAVIQRNATDFSNIFKDVDSDGVHVCDTQLIRFDLPDFKESADLVLPKIAEHFGPDLVVNHAHILESYHPYGIHSDVINPEFNFDTYEPAWTFVIPLETVNSHTIMFHEECAEFKEVDQWIKHYKIKPHKEPIDQQLYNTYLSHTNKNHLKFLTLETIFPWTKGTNFAASRRKFHTSDNYINNGIKSKRAIIMWTAFKK